MENASKMTELLKANAPPQLTQVLEPGFWVFMTAKVFIKSYGELYEESIKNWLWLLFEW